MPASRDSSGSEYVFRLPRRSLQIAGIAFGAGLLLFVIVWLRGRDDAFYQPATATRDAKAEIEALPEPLPARGGASGLEEPSAEGNEQPRLVEEEADPMPAPLEELPAAPATETPLAPPETTTVALAPGDKPVPIPGQTPPPDYPSAELRQGTTGTVLLQVEVGSDGVPVRVNVVSRSGSRELDRAAVDAVQQWRFNPAQREGQAISGTVLIPIDFKLSQ